MHRTSLLILLLIALCPLVKGQKAILLEKRGSLHTQKYFVGETLIYKLSHDRKHWLSEVITDIHIEDNYIEFENRIVHVDSIFALREAAGKGARTASQLLKGFGISWTFWMGVSLILGEDFSWTNAAIGTGSYLVGDLLKIAFFKTHRLKKRKRLRLIDLTFVPPPTTNSR